MARRVHIALDRLAELSPAELKDEWASRYGTPAPDLSVDLLRLGVGYKLQEKRVGAINRSTRSLLRKIGEQARSGSSTSPLPRKLTPGTRLVRDWHGVGHTVEVLEDGFAYDGKRWKSLTAIAKVITGTKWNGPLFFGLAERRK